MRFTDYGPGYSGIDEANREARVRVSLRSDWRNAGDPIDRTRALFRSENFQGDLTTATRRRTP